MTLKPCVRERELAAAIHQGQWPIARDAKLLAHIEECPYCTDLVLIAEALRDFRNEAIEAAPVASPGLLWWRAKLVRRNRALERMGKPISFTGLSAIGLSILGASALVFWQRSQVTDWLSGLDLASADSSRINAMWSQAVMTVPPLLLLLALGAFGLFGGIALYLALWHE